MSNWIFAQQLPLSLLFILLLAGHRPLLQFLGPRTVYAMWLSVPLLLLCSLLPISAGHSDILIVKVTAMQLQQLQQQIQQANWLFWMWALGVVVVGGAILLMQYSLLRLLRRAQPIKAVKGVDCFQSEQLTGPHISGFWRPKVLLPRDFPERFSALQQQLILRHELAHWQRGDLHWNYLALALLVLCWFNPLIWLAYRRYRQDQELACDALVLKDASQQHRIAYSYALISNLQQAANGWQQLTYHYGDKHMIKQRLMQLQTTQGYSKTAVLLSLAAVIAAGLWLQQPAYAGAESAAPAMRIAPVMRIEPKYPVEAAKQRITGYVQAQFNIQPDGSVSDIQIIKAEPADVFNQEAIRALGQWTYQSSAKGVKDATVQLDFMMDPPESDMEQIKVTGKS